MAYTPPPLGMSRPMRPEMDRTGRADSAMGTQTYTVLFQRSNGGIGESRLSAPAHPVFEAAFSAFARGTLITTPRGPVAVEDLVPGMDIVTHERGPSPILWIGAMSLSRPDAVNAAPILTRIMTGALGIGRPLTDLMTGPGARIAQRQVQTGDLLLRPVHELIDGTHVIALNPPGAVQVYHIALRRHATITAAGLGFETYHPGPGFENMLGYQQFGQFMGMFPHVARPSDFGALAHPRAPLFSAPRDVA